MIVSLTIADLSPVVRGLIGPVTAATGTLVQSRVGAGVVCTGKGVADSAGGEEELAEHGVWFVEIKEERKEKRKRAKGKKNCTVVSVREWMKVNSGLAVLGLQSSPDL